MLQKFLISGEIYENRKRYVIFSSGEEFVLNINKSKSSDKPNKEDKFILSKLRNEELINKLSQENNNYWYSIDFKDEEGKEIKLSNIKCFTNPTLISYELEQYKLALFN